MKLVTYTYDGKEQPGVVSSDGLRVYPVSQCGLTYGSMNELIRQAGKAGLQKLAELASAAEGGIAIDEIELQAPIPVPMQDIICVGRNYAEHIKEGARFRLTDFDPTDTPSVYFSKRVNRAVPDGGVIKAHDDMESQLDYESELAVILSRDAYKVKRENAGDYVFGYTIINDVSARTVQNKHKQWYLGKSLDGFTPMGPWIVTADEFSFPPQMTIESRVNGELRQHSSTDLMIYDIPFIIEELSEGMTMLAGSIISTGTPAGVGMGFTPPRFMKKGDVIECSVSGIGTLRNTIG